MNAQARQFEAKPAVREFVPLLIGLMGPSGSGKTFSALRLATGIREVTGGDIYVIDTEARRALHYADKFKFKHIDFRAPFGSLDYLAAVEHCVAQGAGVVVIDSLSHEHEGPGGLLDYHDKELDRLAGNDYAKRERVKMLAWQKPKAARQQMMNAILQMTANFIFCFRAKDKMKLLKGTVMPMGFMPIAGEEIVYEMTANCLLMPKSDGVPTWRSDEIGERMMMKLPEQFKELFAKSRPLDEDTGRALAEWAKGGKQRATVNPVRDAEAGNIGTERVHAARTGIGATPPTGATDDEPTMDELDALLAKAAEMGTASLKSTWDGLSKDQQSTLKVALDRRHKVRAAEVDVARK